MIILEQLEKAKFNLHDTGMSYYNNFLNPKDLKYMQDNKNRTGEIVYMTPEEYYQHCADDIFGGTVQRLKDSRRYSKDKIEKYKEDMLNGDVFPLCMLNYVDKGQEGLHRMLAAGEAFGWDIEYPVLCIYAYDQEKEDRYNKIQEMYDYLRYPFKQDINDICDEVQTKNDIDVPIDLLTQLENEYLKKNNDCEIDVTIYDDRGNYKLKFILVNYKGLDLTDWETSGKIETMFLEDLFDISEGFNPDYIF